MKPRNLTPEQEEIWKVEEAARKREYSAKRRSDPEFRKKQAEYSAARRQKKPDVLTDAQKEIKRKRENARYYANINSRREQDREKYRVVREKILQRHHSKYGTRKQKDARNAALREKLRLNKEYEHFMSMIQGEDAEASNE